MIEHLLPREVAAAAARGDDPLAVLFPEEAAQIHGAIESRVREFATGRACARMALRKLHLPPVSIPRGATREPVWPDGVVGSITHCRGYRAAAAAMRTSIATIGIDAETDEPLPPGTLEQIAVAQEHDWLTAAPPGVHWDRVLFSAKESVFKAWFPVAGTWLGFEDAIVTIQPGSGTFHARILTPVPSQVRCDAITFGGRFMVRAGLILTAIVVRAGGGIAPYRDPMA
nr:4'-phosphopantetheinyl transferase superfamily protein [uncultured Rhodopila sp.]